MEHRNVRNAEDSCRIFAELLNGRAVLRLDVCRRICRVDLCQGVQELLAEVADAGVPLPELFVKRGPGNELRLARCKPVQALRQPNVSIQRH